MLWQQALIFKPVDALSWHSPKLAFVRLKPQVKSPEEL
jgi:hypothetical protein